MEAFSYPLNNFVFSSPDASPQLYDDNFLQSWSDDVQNQQYKLFSSFSSDVKIQSLDSDPKKIEAAPSSHVARSTVEVKAETDTKTSRSRKKRKRTEDEDIGGDISFVTLSRDELLEMSSQELEDRVKLLQQQRPLTAAEKEEIQRQRKLIKNREYAQTSRLKKRETLSTLKGRLDEVSAQNVVLQTQVNHLTQRNRDLELENQQLRVLWTQTTQTYVPTVPMMSTTYPVVPTSVRPFSPETSSYSETGSPSMDDYDSLLGSIPSDSDDTGSFSLDVPLQLDLPLYTNNSNMGMGGGWGIPDPYTSLCLLAILFSFGLFFNWGLPGQEMMVFNSGARSTARMLKEDDPEVDTTDQDGVGGLEGTLVGGGLEFGGKPLELGGNPLNLNFVYFGRKVVSNVTKEIGEEGEKKECPGMLVAVAA